jgi:putative transposase
MGARYHLYLDERRLALFSFDHGFVFSKNRWLVSFRAYDKGVSHESLPKAVHQRKPQPGLIHHSDRGSQYASNEYQAMLRQYGIQTSMSRKRNCYDNACAESSHSVMKKELIFHETFTTREEAKHRIFEYMECFYNAQRIHSANEYMSPMEYEKLRQQSEKQQCFSPQVTI